jgi:peptidoglycan/xylan/chitin deacetylase (PgdA/CDA1 family)
VVAARWRRAFQNAVTNRSPDGYVAEVKTLLLTFDDGPDPRWTPRLLDLLSRAGARATFFPIARRAAAQPELMARIVAEGHGVGLHCDEHIRHSSRDATWLRADTEHALECLSGIGITPRLWRTPWGDLAPWTAGVADELGLRIVGWNVDSHDWRGDPAQDMFAAIRSQLRPGAIVLAHDGIGPGAQRTDASQTLALMTLVTADAAQRGLNLTALQ